MKKKIYFSIAFIILLIIIYHIPHEWVHDSSNSICIHKKLFDVECPFCGMTRASYDIMHFDFTNAIHENFVVIPFFFTTAFWILFLFFKNKTLRKASWIMTFITAFSFLIIYILRISGTL